MWKIGPACAPQQRKKVEDSTMNCGERKAALSDSIGASDDTPAIVLSCAMTGGRRTSSDAGISNVQAPMPMISIALRRPYAAISQLAKGEIVIGATPTPADTSDTARLRFSV